MDKQEVLRRLENALISEERFAKAAADKKRFDEWIMKTKEECSKTNVTLGDFLRKLDKQEVRQATGGLDSPFERFLDLEDPFFAGLARWKYMELGTGFVNRIGGSSE